VLEATVEVADFRSVVCDQTELADNLGLILEREEKERIEK
jgi:hypothetical protein